MIAETEQQVASLRDYFAARAMQAHFIIDAIVCNVPGEPRMDMSGHDAVAREAYRTADAMLAARKAGQR